jgi:tetraacyldisaccharide 4'-kinase
VRLIERVWYGGSTVAGGARTVLAPVEAVYACGVAVRNALYDSGRLAQYGTAVPALSVGNLSVGGTGKTPVTAWLAQQLVTRGAHPAIVLRGYGNDEPLVHERLNPDVPVIVSPDRVAGSVRASASGADVVLFDDAFQHRRASRVADVVVVSADQWLRSRRLLPAGPLREPLRALRRATLMLVTRKAASLETASLACAGIARAAPGVPLATAHLALDALHAAANAEAPRQVASLAGTEVLAVSAIGNPQAFAAQLAAAGAHVRSVALPDHHAYSRDDAGRLARAADGVDLVVCTLKDVVKLAQVWPRQAVPLWYVSQQLVVEHGGAAVDAALQTVLDARRTHT